MARVLCFTNVNLVSSPPKLSEINSTRQYPKSSLSFQTPISHCPELKFQSLIVKAASEGDKGTKINSIVCAQCEGNGAIVCTQCEGSGRNKIDHFNGKFKAGGLCWLCNGKREILCGNCNGAGFMGGFLSSFDETSA